MTYGMEVLQREIVGSGYKKNSVCGCSVELAVISDENNSSYSFEEKKFSRSFDEGFLRAIKKIHIENREFCLIS